MKKVLFLLLIVGSANLAIAQDQHLIDSLIRTLKTSKPDTNKVNILNNLSKNYEYGNLEKGMDYARQALALSQQISFKKGIADALNNMGNTTMDKGDLLPALELYKKSLNIRIEIDDKKGVAGSCNNIGTVFDDQGNYPEALKYYYAALKINEQMGNKKWQAINLRNIGLIHFWQGNYPEALKKYSLALKIGKELGDKKIIADSYSTIANVYELQKNFTEALNNYNLALIIYKEIQDKTGIATCYINFGNINDNQDNYEQAMNNYIEAKKINEEVGNKEGIAVCYNNMGNTSMKYKKFPESSKYLNKGLLLFKEIGSLEGIRQTYGNLSKLDSLTGHFKQSLDNYKLYIVNRDSLYNEENTKKIVKTQMQYDFDKKEAVAKAEQEKKDALSQKEVQKQKWVRNGFVGGFAIVLLFASVFFMQRIRISKEKKKSDREKNRSEELLLNILPFEVAEELKATGSAKAKTFSMVSVMFTDFKDFTKISESVSAELLVEEIHYCFSAFDAIVQKYKIEKIKTIGDAYLCASGLPVLNYTHAVDIINAAIEIRDFMQQRKKEKEAKGEMPFELRIGIHTGPVVAGIVGVKKFAYDIWGDTVNIAARMEQNSEAGKINISGSTYLLVKDKFTCTHRGKIEAKNKGEIDMYFVEEL